ncbi:hypothetical protein VNO77_04598 [Canavalia gladiata]|uniref:Uncharacterized protein n=1 Tax=Canavalia gladiata TaxID=3824 RepID=A0AAN9N3B1_CANGL
MSPLPYWKVIGLLPWPKVRFTLLTVASRFHKIKIVSGSWLMSLQGFKHRTLHFARMIEPGLGFSESDPEILHLSDNVPILVNAQSQIEKIPDLVLVSVAQGSELSGHWCNLLRLSCYSSIVVIEISSKMSCRELDQEPNLDDVNSREYECSFYLQMKMEPNLSEIDSGNVKVFFLVLLAA